MKTFNLFLFLFTILYIINHVNSYNYNSTGKKIETLINGFRINAEIYGPVPDTPLQSIHWSDDIAYLIQKYVNTCQVNTPDSSYGSGQGYSLFKVMNKEFDPVDVLNRTFIKSAPLYDWKTALCKDDQCCENYASMIWNTTTKVGCAANFCKDPNSSEGGFNVFACGFYPIGNFNGVLPYKPKPSNDSFSDGNAILERHNSVETNNTGPYVLEGSSDDVNWKQLGFVTSIKDQGSCGGCYSFATCASLESAYLIKNNLPNHDIDLSEQHFISCSGLGCGGGNGQGSLNALASSGVLYENEFPYKVATLTCPVVTSLLSTFKWQSYSNIKASKSSFIEALKSGPIYAAVYVDSGFQSYKSGVYSCPQSSTPNHAITLVGYSSADDSFLVKNSWGTYFGQGGYMYIASGSCNLFYLNGILPSV